MHNTNYLSHILTCPPEVSIPGRDFTYDLVDPGSIFGKHEKWTYKKRYLDEMKHDVINQMNAIAKSIFTALIGSLGSSTQHGK
jgi:hypothetical protein